VPFYATLPTTIVKNCLLNFDIASRLQRYPVVTRGRVKYETFEKCLSYSITHIIFLEKFMKQDAGIMIIHVILQ